MARLEKLSGDGSEEETDPLPSKTALLALAAFIEEERAEIAHISAAQGDGTWSVTEARVQEVSDQIRTMVG